MRFDTKVTILISLLLLVCILLAIEYFRVNKTIELTIKTQEQCQTWSMGPLKWCRKAESYFPYECSWLLNSSSSSNDTSKIHAATFWIMLISPGLAILLLLVAIVLLGLAFFYRGDLAPKRSFNLTRLFALLTILAHICFLTGVVYFLIFQRTLKDQRQSNFPLSVAFSKLEEKMTSSSTYFSFGFYYLTIAAVLNAIVAVWCLVAKALQDYKRRPSLEDATAPDKSSLKPRTTVVDRPWDMDPLPKSQTNGGMDLVSDLDTGVTSFQYRVPDLSVNSNPMTTFQNNKPKIENGYNETDVLQNHDTKIESESKETDTLELTNQLNGSKSIESDTLSSFEAAIEQFDPTSDSESLNEHSVRIPTTSQTTGDPELIMKVEGGHAIACEQ